MNSSWKGLPPQLIFLLVSTGAFARPATAADAASAVGPPTLAPQSEGEIYRRHLVQAVLDKYHLKIDPRPAGKRIEKILIAPYDVLSAGDPWPGILKAFHARTKSEVIRRELLFGKGDRWDQKLVDETERNLLNYLFISTAEIVACRGSTPDQVGVLVVTKDLWSLRVNTDFSYADSQLEGLRVETVENNLGGWNRTLGAVFQQDLATNSFGLEFADPRVTGSRIGVTTTANLILNRASGLTEGGQQTLGVTEPLYSLETEWAWTASVNHLRNIYRLFSAGALNVVTDSTTGESLPYSYGEDLWSGTAAITHSGGLSFKNDVSFGWKGYSRGYTLPVSPTSVSPQTIADFESTILPVSEKAGMLFANYHFYQPLYVELEDIDTFALAEHFQLGPDFSLEGRVAEPAFGFNSHFFEAASGASYRWWRNDDLLTLGSSFSARYESGQYPGTPWINELASIRVQNGSPRFGIFRFFSQAQLIRRVRDIERDFETLGGDTLLRGFPSAFFVGPNLWTANFELRTTPAEFHTIYAGLIGFVDMGDAFSDPASASLHASVGGGLRVVFPQFNRAVLRMDVGVPLETLPGVSPVSVVAQFGQAFD